ncbi:MAG TPA: LacI family DNA-binding transcriptional regulator [Chloroflexota bacterium]|nr:LacI family DNA-binding transcriptional regulator [Chloroflexota bacterium]
MTDTLRDVALHAGVSISTASRVLSGSSHPVAADARERVLRAAEELGFTPNAFARGLSKREFRLIGLVIPDMRDPYFVEIARGAEELANQRGYLTILCNTNREPDKERSYVQTLRAMRAGIILTGGGIDREAHLRDLATHPAPVVVIGRHALPCSSVLIDNLRGAMDATAHLIGLGRRRIAFIGGPSSSATAADRLVGFRRAMEENGLSIDEDLVVDGDFSLEGGARAARALLRQTHAPDAIFAANDEMALGVMREARHQGIRIPEELAIVGFNGIAATAETDPPLTTIQLSLGRIGQIATDLLLKQVEKKEKEQVAVTIKGELVVAGSTVPQCEELHCAKRM